MPRYSEQHLNQTASNIPRHSEQHPDQRINGGQTTPASHRRPSSNRTHNKKPKSFQRAATACGISIYFRTEFNSDIIHTVTLSMIKCNLVFKCILCKNFIITLFPVLYYRCNYCFKDVLTHETIVSSHVLYTYDQRFFIMRLRQ